MPYKILILIISSELQNSSLIIMIITFFILTFRMKLLALLFSLSSALFVTVLPRREECFHETGKAGDKVSSDLSYEFQCYLCEIGPE